jgi:glycosyltransferase involved in cell wall biosynthesis
MISVVIIANNESINIERCIKSVSWSDDIFVLDSGSVDGTQSLARAMGARVGFREYDNYANQRNYALDFGQLKYQWVLHLDADEESTASLEKEIFKIAKLGGEKKKGYLVPMKLIFMGRWLRFAAMYPSYQARFGARDTLRFLMVGHGHREALSLNEMGVLEGAIRHHNFSKGISDWMIRHSKYAAQEAEESILDLAKPIRLSEAFGAGVVRRRFFKSLSYRMPFRPFVRFFYVYVVSLGFLDGFPGLRYSFLMAIYQWMIDINVQEKRIKAANGHVD